VMSSLGLGATHDFVSVPVSSSLISVKGMALFFF